MDDQQKRTLLALRRILSFVHTTHLEHEPPLLAKMRTSLEASLTRIQNLHRTQNTSRFLLTGEPRSLDGLRNKLRRERMMPLVKVAKPLLKFAPGTASALRVPHARASSTEVARAALRLANALKPHSKLLASAGYSKQFVLAMREEAATIAATTARNEKALQARARATSRLAAEFKKAKGTVTVIEGILTPHLLANPHEAATWRSERRVHAPTGRPRKRRT